MPTLFEAENYAVELDDQRTDEGDAQEVQPFRYAISSYGADYPVDGLVKRIRDGAIYVPKFQREFVWDVKDASRFVESLLLGLPVPSIFLSKELDTGKLLVVDVSSGFFRYATFIKTSGNRPERNSDLKEFSPSLREELTANCERRTVGNSTTPSSTPSYSSKMNHRRMKVACMRFFSVSTLGERSSPRKRCEAPFITPAGLEISWVSLMNTNLGVKYTVQKTAECGTKS
jgi:hypothetical protein